MNKSTGQIKFSNYQKIMFAWGLVVFVAYICSNIALSAPTLVFNIWLFGIIIGLGVQLLLGFGKDFKTLLLQALWILIVLAAAVLTYIEYIGVVKVGIAGMMSGWFFMCAGGMFITSLIYKFNVSYLILTGLYGIIGLYLAYSTMVIPQKINVSAVAFLVLFIVDAALEYSSWRKNLADSSN